MDRFTLAPGQRIGNYRLVCKLGEGGVGMVYEAQHVVLSRRAAIKVLRPELSADQEMVSRLFTEAESANRVGHPGIVNIFEFLTLPDQSVCIVMEFLEGEPLSTRIANAPGGRLSLSGLRLLRQVASALAAAHTLGIVHRDLKPDNVMVVKDPEVPGGERAKLVDFGIAKMRSSGLTTGMDLNRTQVGMIMGTPAYMSPEQLRDTGSVDDRADVYSLGVMLFQVLTGHLPFNGAFPELAAGHLYSPAPRIRSIDPSLPEALDDLVAQMLSKLGADRPSMEAVAEILERFSAPSASSQSTQRLGQPGRPPTVAISPDGKTLPSITPPKIQETLGKPTSPPASPSSRALVIGLSAGAASALGLLALFLWGKDPLAPSQPAKPTHSVPTSRVETVANKAEVIDLPSLRNQARAVLLQALAEADPQHQRRAALAIAQSRDAHFVLPITNLLKDAEPEVLSALTVALRQLGEPSSIEALETALQREGLPEEVRAQIAGALAWLAQGSGDRGQGWLKKALRAKDPQIRELAALFLSERGDRKARSLLLESALRSEEQVGVLGRLSRAGDRQAFEALSRHRVGGALDELQIRVAEELARGDDEEARTFLEKLARAAGPLRMRAARSLAGLDDPAFFDLFVKTFADKGASLQDRLLSAEGLGTYGHKEAAPGLAASLPKDASSVERLRLGAASAILLIAGADPEILRGESVARLSAGLRDKDQEIRSQAALALGEAEPKAALPLLSSALKDEETQVRRNAAVALGKTKVREAVPVLGEALQDGKVVVRTEALRSMGRVSKHLQEQGESVKEMVSTLRDKAESGAVEEQAASAAALLSLQSPDAKESAAKLGDKMRSLLTHKDPEIRREVAAAWAKDKSTTPDQLTTALKDKTKEVRFAAACALARQGSKDGLGVLEAALKERGGEAIIARAWLSHLGATPETEVTLGDGNLEDRLARTQAAPHLPVLEALALLRQAARDLASKVRLRVLEVLAESPTLLKEPGGQKILGELLLDRDPLVRSHAGLLRGKTTKEASSKDVRSSDTTPSASPQDAAPPPEKVDQGISEPKPTESTKGSEPQKRGQLLVEADPDVPFQIGKGKPQTAKGQPISLPQGRHRVTYSGGVLDVDVTAGETVTVKIPVSAAEYFLNEAALAFDGGNIQEAERLLLRTRKGKLGKAQLSTLYYYQGRLYEARGRLVEAMMEFEKSPQQKDEKLKAAMARVSASLGRVRISQEVEGQCQTSSLWLRPGVHMVDVGGSRQEVRVKPGDNVEVSTCKK